jgi:hypothetical protein
MAAHFPSSNSYPKKLLCHFLPLFFPHYCTGALPLEHARPKPSSKASNGSKSTLSSEEQQLLQSLQRLDKDLLRKVASGILSAQAAPSPAAAAAAACQIQAQSSKRAGIGSSGGVSEGISGARERRSGSGDRQPVNNSLKQLQLRESIEKLDQQLHALKSKVTGETV